MRKKILLLTLATFFTLLSKAQYGTRWMGYPMQYNMGAGIATSHTPGVVFVGYNNPVSNVPSWWYTDKNFTIAGFGPSQFHTSYRLYTNSSCSGIPTQITSGNGVNMIESAGPNNMQYALVGSHNEGCYFISLNKSGGLISKMAYTFPGSISGNYNLPSKPIITELANQNQYFICGSFENEMYILHVNASGTILWSSLYTLFKGMEPKDLIVNPNNSKELIVVGETNTGSDKQAFFMSVSAGNGQVITTKTYGNPVHGDGFASITASSSNSGGSNGFIVGGYVNGGATLNQLNATGKSAWICKLDASGTILWSNKYIPSIGFNGGVIDVLERLNTLNTYECFALMEANCGMQVLKLDENGHPFPTSAPNAMHNEYVYNLPGVNDSKPVNMSFNNNQNTSGFQGLQVFGTATNFSGFVSSHYVGAYYNGETPCNRTYGNIQHVSKGPAQSVASTVSGYGALTSCSNFTVDVTFNGVAVNISCNTITQSGSNQRPAITGIEEEEHLKDEQFSVFPNPVKDKATVTYSSADNSEVNIQVFNVLGQHVQTITPNRQFAGTYQQEIDFSSLQIESGIYIVNTIVDGVIHKQKVMYSK